MNKNDVIKFLNSWKDGVIGIGNKFLEDANYNDEAKLFLDQHYAFDQTKVLFKPTFTKEIIFRNNKQSALSYFIAGDIAEDNGFAIRPWKCINVLDVHFMLEEEVSVVMGVLNLEPFHEGKDTKVAFTFVLDTFDGDIKIKAHHSSPIND